jgi:restriction system protein
MTRAVQDRVATFDSILLVIESDRSRPISPVDVDVAKRYSGMVPVNAVRALAGVMDDKRASRGLLVTTSWLGKASHEFAARHGRIQLIKGGELKHLLAEHMNLDVVIGPLKRRTR